MSMSMSSLQNAALGPYLRVLPPLGKSWRRWSNRQAVAQARELVPAILRAVPHHVGLSSPATWRLQQVEWTFTRTVVMTVGPLGQPPAAVVKLPHTGSGAASLRQQQAVMATLHADARLDGWRSLIPVPLVQGEIAGQVYAVEQALPGRDMRSLLHDPTVRIRACRAAAAAIGQLHRRTAWPVVVTSALLERWVDQPLGQMRHLTMALPRASDYARTIERIGAELHTALAGRTVRVGWIHGDFWASNLLLTPDGARLTGIVDWDQAIPDDLPIQDMMDLLIITRSLVAYRWSPIDTIRALLIEADWSPEERALLRMTEMPLAGDPAGERISLLLYWLRYIATYLAKYPHQAGQPRWVAQNIETVLRCL